ncbi:hypothetical protein BB561_005168 [Smittium simulii]|uniref:Peptidase A2 domain-containing protein n=1 Tax=Smittium simulii TaxID=133385 RepID=A0A2T9YBR1_9FUNG|nr:hypothetical protein BB561_005168 [Smittium simulii]
MKPQLSVDLVSGLQSFKRTNVRKKILIENASNQNKALLFVRVMLRNQPIAIYIDNGADYSIVNSKFIEEMDLELAKMERPYIIRPLKGLQSTVDKVAYIHVTFKWDIIVTIDFLVMENIAVQAILRIDVLQAIKAKIDYANKIKLLKLSYILGKKRWIGIMVFLKKA